ncbi:MATE family efflux transporter [Caldisalinibacter kiritimatiensis]|uniref:Probable multidrug resistance protein NorM n=1 Tax=Caldisalinibacter kiritimatiensis TaxID=1304284 RepID=R1AUW6_9FIRM|nr:MATE family efflux transporter [Caldisalinibacter kiritimatiensis]EOD00943.1 Multi antimicrobial extrusion protein (Na(+)/drug antiporter) [Caldisalinibacter kiritimatiensis]
MVDKLVKANRIKLIWSLAWPVMMSQLLQTFLQIADMWFISTINIIEIIAGIGFSTSILGVIIVFSQLVAAGSIALISRKTGEGDSKGLIHISLHALILAVIVGSTISIMCYAYAKDILFMFGAEGSVLLYGEKYLKLVLISIPFTFFNLTGRAILQAKGDTITPMIIFIIMNFLNIILDPLLIHGVFFFPNLSFKGAALATVISNILAFILMVYFINSKIFNAQIIQRFKNSKIDINIMFRITKIGFFSAIQAVSRPITGLIMFKIASYSGTEAVAAFTVGGRVFNLVFIFLMGLTTSISVLTGQNLGKNAKEEAKRVISDGIKLAALNMIVFAIPYFIFPKYIMLLFTKEIEVVNIGINYLRIVYIGVLFVIFPVVYGGAFIGAGDTAPPMIASMVANWGFKIPFAYYFAKILKLGSNWVWLAISISVIVEAIVITYWFRKGKWLEKEV